MTAPLTGNLLEDLKHATSPESFSPLSACLTMQLADRLNLSHDYDDLDVLASVYDSEDALLGLQSLFLGSGAYKPGPEGHAQAVKLAEDLFA